MLYYKYNIFLYIQNQIIIPFPIYIIYKMKWQMKMKK